MYIREILNSKHKGFMGRTHFLMTIGLFMSLWLLPESFPLIGSWANQYVNFLKSDYLYLAVIFAVVGGAACAPDIDSNPMEEGGSTIIYQLGIMGQVLSLVTVIISHVTWSVCHLAGDKKPKSAHRLLFHTLLLPGLGYMWINFLIPNSNDVLGTNFSIDNIGVYFAVFLLAICVYIGTNMMLYKPLAMLKQYNMVHIASWAMLALSLIYFVYKPMIYIKFAAQSMWIAYAAHVVEDCLTEGGSPLLFPIPLPGNILGAMGNGPKKLQMWFNKWLPFAILIRTGGIVNTVLDYILTLVDIYLFYIVFFR